MKTTEYYRITLQIPAEEADLVEGILYLEGVEGLEETPTTLKAYFKKGSQPIEKLMENLRRKLPSSVTLRVESVTSAGFQSLPFDPLELLPGLWILPPPDMAQTPLPHRDGSPIVIRPGMAFGTGRHESTMLCAEAIRAVENRAAKTLLDVGTGSGILAILAAKLGFQKIDAVEIDPDAIANALENFELNQMQTIRLFDTLGAAKEKYNVIAANIDPPTLLLLQKALIGRLSPKGELILGGITQAQKEAVESGFGALKKIGRLQKNEWLCCRFKLDN